MGLETLHCGWLTCFSVTRADATTSTPQQQVVALSPRNLCDGVWSIAGQRHCREPSIGYTDRWICIASNNDCDR